MRRYLFPLALLLIAGGTFGWWWYQPEKVLARRVTGLFSAANVESGAGTISRSNRGNAIEPFLAPSITFEGPDGPTEEIEGPQTRSTIVSLFTLLARHCRSISIRSPEFDAIRINGDQASVAARVDAIIDLPNEQRPVDGIQHLAMDWRKIEGRWCLEAARWRETGR